MQKDIYIHVGPPKTGSSAIQYWLQQNNRFLAKNNIFYPIHNTSTNGVSSGNLRVIYDVSADGTLVLNMKKIWKLLNDFETGPYTILLLSSEFFSNKLHELKECFNSPKFIFYIRNPVEVRESNYNQAVKRHGQTDILKPSDSTHLPHLEKLAIYSREFGNKDIIVRFYGEAFFFKGNLIADFMSVFNLNVQVNNVIINQSYQFEAMEFKRWLNHYSLEGIQASVDNALQRFQSGSSNYSLFRQSDYLRQCEVFIEVMKPLLFQLGVENSEEFYNNMLLKRLQEFKKQELDEEAFISVLKFLSKELSFKFYKLTDSVLTAKNHPNQNFVDLISATVAEHAIRIRIIRSLQKFVPARLIKFRNLVTIVNRAKSLLVTFYRLILKQVRRNVPIKIKLVAVARNEAAYLSEWIFHHLYFGFDEIHIYINGTTDNTLEIIDQLKSLKKVKIQNGDYFYKQNVKSPQNVVYKHELEKSYREGFSHVMFLDIDEFWISKNFNTSITEYAEKNNFDVNSFEWLNKTNEHALFSPPIPVELIGVKTSQIKSLIKTGLSIKAVNPHSVLVDNASYRLADGTAFKPEKGKIRAPLEELNKSIKDYFVLHRMYRSQIEYVAMLSTPIAIKSDTNSQIFKDNRSGYCTDDFTDVVRLPKEEHDAYCKEYCKFIEEYQLQPSILKARKMIEDKFLFTIDLIQNAQTKEATLLKRLLKNVTLEAVLRSYDNFKSRQGLKD
ncbi:glycosyltransferase family 2 protein [Paraglaciecola sp.]|uniref:glycosyltransferase family 2 protein n=1 Tax=Paraglaciecola sp. TaxID=1920173 RepID=UPI0027402853|nr:glycosyltransferase family 2 protein [Paraglaciecola sp.]MDP5031852.1 glycosyltransferase family 2 protein [Paraglaciecola sp.]